MKKYLSVPFLFLLLISCEGPAGPPGFDGQDGQDGVNILGQIFEAQVNFNANSNFEALVNFPSNIEVFDTDVVLAYILVGNDNGIDVWEPLPQTLFFQDGTFLYGFNHTFQDILFFLDGTVNLNNLSPDLTQNIVFRIAIIPAEAAKNLNLNNIENVLNAIQNKNIIKLKQ